MKTLFATKTLFAMTAAALLAVSGTAWAQCGGDHVAQTQTKTTVASSGQTGGSTAGSQVKATKPDS